MSEESRKKIEDEYPCIGGMSDTVWALNYRSRVAAEFGYNLRDEELKEAIGGELADAREELHGATGSHDIAEIESRIITLKKVIKVIKHHNP